MFEPCSFVQFGQWSCAAPSVVVNCRQVIRTYVQFKMASQQPMGLPCITVSVSCSRCRLHRATNQGKAERTSPLKLYLPTDIPNPPPSRHTPKNNVPKCVVALRMPCPYTHTHTHMSICMYVWSCANPTSKPLPPPTRIQQSIVCPSIRPSVRSSVCQSQSAPKKPMSVSKSQSAIQFVFAPKNEKKNTSFIPKLCYDVGSEAAQQRRWQQEQQQQLLRERQMEEIKMCV